MKPHLVVGYLILGAIGVGTGWLLVAAMPWAEWRNDQDLPAWVQAVGSVFAILLAVAVPAVQHLLSERRIRDEAASGARRQHALAVMLTEEALQICETLLQTIAQQRLLGGGLAFPTDSLADWREKFRSVDYSSLRPEAATLLAETKGLLGLVEATYRTANGQVVSAFPNEGVHNAAQAIRKRLEQMYRIRV